ncbi:MAG TPA: hypothetical protein VLD57_10540 [Blastocatellia bacterium]|nr:hypothetical protein [Blastocatellia bacterium]
MKTQRLSVILTVFNLLVLIIVLAQNQKGEAQGVAPVLRGRALEIVDERGQVRARINIEPASTTMPDGKTYPESAVLRLTDPNGRIRVKLGADIDGSGLMLADDSQQPGVHMLAKGSGSFLKLINKGGQERVIKP